MLLKTFNFTVSPIFKASKFISINQDYVCVAYFPLECSSPRLNIELWVVAVYAETCCVVLFQKEPLPVIIQNFWFKKHKRDNIPKMSGIHVLGLTCYGMVLLLFKVERWNSCKCNNSWVSTTFGHDCRYQFLAVLVHYIYLLIFAMYVILCIPYIV